MENDDEKIADELLDKLSLGDKNAFHELEKLAEDGNARAMSNLAQIYLKGFGVIEISYKNAVELFKKAAALNEVYALFRLGEFYRDAKYGFKQDGHKAAEYFIRAAEYAVPSGAAKCLRLAAEIYHYGKGGVAPDGFKAIELYEKLDEVESLGGVEIRFIVEKALFRIADIYTNGCGSLQADGLKAVEYLNKAAERGDEWFAFYELTNLYREGKAGIQVDGCKVIEYLTKRGDLKEIAQIYRDGKYGIKADGYKAIEYFLKKFERREDKTFDEIAETYLKNRYDYEFNDAGNYFDGMKAIGGVNEFRAIAEIYCYGKGGVKPDSKKAIEYFLKASEGIDNAIEFTKKFIELNSDVKKKSPVVLKRFFQWSKSNSKNIHEQLAKIENNANFPTDELKHFEHLTKTSDENSKWAFHNLANIYLEGKYGIEPDATKAIEYFTKINDWHSIAEIYLEGKAGVVVDGHKAIEYFDKATDFESIAEIYRYGKDSVQPDKEKAIEYFLKYETANRCPDDESDEFYISLAKDRRARAFRNIAEIYYFLNDGQKALEYFLKADECDDEWAYINVANIYRYGKGNLKADGVKFIEYLTKKLEQNESLDDLILYDIAKAYEEGCGSLEPNTQKALEFYRKAAALGNDFAKEELAIRKLL